MTDEIIAKLLTSPLMEDNLLGFEYCIKKYGIRNVLKAPYTVGGVTMQYIWNAIYIYPKGSMLRASRFTIPESALLKLLRSNDREDVELGYDICKRTYINDRYMNRYLKQHNICIVRGEHLTVYRNVDWKHFYNSDPIIILK